MPFYAQLNDNNICVGVSDLSGIVESENMLEIAEYDTGLLGKHWNGETWEDVPQPQPQPPEPTEQELVQAEMLLNQIEIMSRQNEQDEVLAEILLNQLGV